MTHILKAKIRNFKKFREYEIHFAPKRNILIRGSGSPFDK